MFIYKVNWPVVLKLDNHQLNRGSTSNTAGTEVQLYIVLRIILLS